MLPVSIGVAVESFDEIIQSRNVHPLERGPEHVTADAHHKQKYD